MGTSPFPVSERIVKRLQHRIYTTQLKLDELIGGQNYPLTHPEVIRLSHQLDIFVLQAMRLKLGRGNPYSNGTKQLLPCCNK